MPNKFTLVGPWALGYNFFLINPPYPPSGAPCCAHAHVPAMALMLHDDSTPMHALGQDKQLPLVQHVVCCPCLLSQYCDPGHLKMAPLGREMPPRGHALGSRLPPQAPRPHQGGPRGA